MFMFSIQQNYERTLIRSLKYKYSAKILVEITKKALLHLRDLLIHYFMFYKYLNQGMVQKTVFNIAYIILYSINYLRIAALKFLYNKEKVS